MLAVDASSLEIIGEAGDTPKILGDTKVGLSVANIIGPTLADRLADTTVGHAAVLGRVVGALGSLDVVAFRSGACVVVEFDQTEGEVIHTIPYLVTLDAASLRFERSISVRELP